MEAAQAALGQARQQTRAADDRGAKQVPYGRGNPHLPLPAAWACEGDMGSHCGVLHLASPAHLQPRRAGC